MLEFLGLFVNQTVKMLELLGFFVNHTVKMLMFLGEPDSKHAGSSRSACETHGQDAGFFMTCTVKMLEFLGLTQSTCWGCEDLL